MGLTFSAVIAFLGGVRATIFAGLLLLALVFAGVQTFRHGHVVREFDGYKATVESDRAKAIVAQKTEEARYAKLQADYYQKASEARKAYEDGRQSGLLANQTVVSDLRSGNKRLQNGWQSCLRATPKAPEAGAAGRADDEAPGVPAEAFGRVLSVGSDADAQVTWLQTEVRALYDLANQCGQ